MKETICGPTSETKETYNFLQKYNGGTAFRMTVIDNLVQKGRK